MQSQDNGIKVACIIGFGRSGSTVLDTVLGNHPDAESLGELVNLPTRGWTNNEYCACGTRVNDCGFWNQVRARWNAACPLDDVADYVALQRGFERARSLPRLLRGRRSAGPELARYRDLTRTLYESVSEVSGKRILIDSSKSPVRAFSLAQVPGLDVRVIHLVRDPRGVAWSLAKSYLRDDRGGVQHDIPGVPVAHTAWEWSANNALSLLVPRLLERRRSVRVRYEDVMERPREELDRIGRLLDLDYGAVATRVVAGEPMAVNHTVAGNRVRMQGSIRLAADTEWHANLPRRDRWLVGAIAGPLMLGLGYGPLRRR